MMPVRPEVIPFLIGAFGVSLLYVLIARLCGTIWRRVLLRAGLVFLVLAAYMVYFFRDPERDLPSDPTAVVAAAEGKLAKVESLDEAAFRRAAQSSGLSEQAVAEFLKGGRVVRISIFLSLIDVHVNRTPISGVAEFLGYFPGKRMFTFDDKSSEVNQHNAILIRGSGTICLVNQIVGPVCRRVVYWLDHDKPVRVDKGLRFGMMKFGSRLDMYFPEQDVEVLVPVGQKVRVGETVIAKLRKGVGP